MIHEPTEYEPTEYETAEYETAEHLSPPLCLVHYFSEHGPDPPAPDSKLRGRVAGRDGNLILLEFAAAPKSKPPQRDTRKVWDVLTLLLVVTSLIACAAAFR